MTEATPRPWVAQPTDIALRVAPWAVGDYLITNTDERQPLVSVMGHCDEAEANAALIVRAVNNLEPLMEALKGLVAATANVIDVGPAYDQAVRALKAAEEATS